MRCEKCHKYKAVGWYHTKNLCTKCIRETKNDENPRRRWIRKSWLDKYAKKTPGSVN